MDPTTFAEMRPGAYDIDERVRDMNRNGILASMCFPSFAGFSAGFFQRAADKDLALVMPKAYNDWHIDEWAASHPGPVHPPGHPPGLGPRGAGGRGPPGGRQGLPRHHHAGAAPHPGSAELSRHRLLGPVLPTPCRTSRWSCACTSVRASPPSTPRPDAPIDNLIILATQVSALAAQDLLWGPAFRNCPDLKVAWSEAGIGWIPFYLNRCDRHYPNQRWLGHDFGDKLPSDIFREHSLACYVIGPDGPQGARGHRDRHHRLGVRLPAFRLDLSRRARSSCITSWRWPACPTSDIDKITWQNTCRFFGWDPFEHLPRDEATVGALRGRSPDVDTTIRSKHEWRRRYEATGARS